jgi:hypothetical protein
MIKTGLITGIVIEKGVDFTTAYNELIDFGLTLEFLPK